MIVAVAMLVHRVEPNGASVTLDVAVIQGAGTQQELATHALRDAARKYPKEHGYSFYQVRAYELPMECVQKDGWVRAETKAVSEEIVTFLSDGSAGTS